MLALTIWQRTVVLISGFHTADTPPCGRVAIRIEVAVMRRRSLIGTHFCHLCYKLFCNKHLPSKRWSWCNRASLRFFLSDVRLATGMPTVTTQLTCTIHMIPALPGQEKNNVLHSQAKDQLSSYCLLYSLHIYC